MPLYSGTEYDAFAVGEWREVQRTGNGGRQVYTVRVYRLKDGT